MKMEMGTVSKEMDIAPVIAPAAMADFWVTLLCCSKMLNAFAPMIVGTTETIMPTTVHTVNAVKAKPKSDVKEISPLMMAITIMTPAHNATARSMFNLAAL
jgi:hypothetical protein